MPLIPKPLSHTNILRLRTVAAWLFSVLLFSGIYFLLWKVNPDSFIVNKEFNLTPYEQLRSTIDMRERNNFLPSYNADKNTELDVFLTTVEEIDREATVVQEKIKRLNDEQAKLEIAETAVYSIHSAKLAANIEHYKKEATKVEVRNVNEAQNEYDELVKRAKNSSLESAALAAANAKVKLASANYALSLRQAKVADYVVNNFKSFADPSTFAQLDSKNTALREIAHKQRELDDQLIEIRKTAFSKLDEWYSSRTSRLEWVDFLYFSAGVSTTSTFGDIIPNIRLIRVFILFQLVFSVLIVGFFVNLISSGSGTATIDKEKAAD